MGCKLEVIDALVDGKIEGSKKGFFESDWRDMLREEAWSAAPRYLKARS